MAALLFAKDIAHAYNLANREVYRYGTDRPSERGDTMFLPNLLLVVNNPDAGPMIPDNAPPVALYDEMPNEAWVITNDDHTTESYEDRMLKPIDQTRVGSQLIKKYPHTRRFSYSIARPWDILSKTPPSLMEIFVQAISKGDGEPEDSPSEIMPGVHVTGFYRSLDVYNYLNINLIGLAEVQQRIITETDMNKGTLAIMAANAHYYKRDEKNVAEINETQPAPPTPHAALIESENIPFGWHQTLEYIDSSGFTDKTQWGEVFAKQGMAKYAHRLMVDISNPTENMLDDQAPFTRVYGEEYAMRYIIGKIGDEPAKEGDITLTEDEVYTYASRARWDRNDKMHFGRQPVDQLHHAIQLLKSNKWVRRAAVNISRPWDLTSSDPACLRAYVMQAIDKETLGITLFMRSNDAYGATHANQYGFARLAEYVASCTGFNKVRVTLLSANMHIYGDSLDAVDKMLRPDMPSLARQIFEKTDENNPR